MTTVQPRPRQVTLREVVHGTCVPPLSNNLDSSDFPITPADSVCVNHNTIRHVARNKTTKTTVESSQHCHFTLIAGVDLSFKFGIVLDRKPNSIAVRIFALVNHSQM